MVLKDVDDRVGEEVQLHRLKDPEAGRSTSQMSDKRSKNLVAFDTRASGA